MGAASLCCVASEHSNRDEENQLNVEVNRYGLTMGRNPSLRPFNAKKVFDEASKRVIKHKRGDLEATVK